MLAAGRIPGAVAECELNPQFHGRNLGHSDYLNWGTVQLGEPTQSGHITLERYVLANFVPGRPFLEAWLCTGGPAKV